MTAPATMELAAALLRRALPGLAVLDLAAAAGAAGLYPWVPDALCGVAAPEALAPAERDLLRGFRQRGGARPLFGFDPHEDAALAAGAPEAWGGAEARLVVLAGDAFGAGDWLGGAGAMVLAPDAAPLTAERVMLLLGTAAAVERLDLLLPDGRTAAALLPALEAAARAMAEAGGGGGAGWECGVRTISPRLAALTLFAPDPPAGPALLPAEALILHAEDGGEGTEAPGPRLRLLLGRLPPRPLRLRLALRGAGKAPPVLFLDGARHASRTEVDATGGMLLEAAVTPPAEAAGPTVLGLALPPGGPPLRVERLEIGAA